MQSLIIAREGFMLNYVLMLVDINGDIITVKDSTQAGFNKAMQYIINNSIKNIKIHTNHTDFSLKLKERIQDYFSNTEFNNTIEIEVLE